MVITKQLPSGNYLITVDDNLVLYLLPKLIKFNQYYGFIVTNGTLYAQDFGTIGNFNNHEIEMEDPQIYKTLKAAQKRCSKEELHYKNKWYIAIWCHENFYLPLQKYLKITGTQLPGSPTQ